MSDTALNTVVIGKYRLDPVAEFEGPRMPPTAMFTRSDPQHLARLLERTPAGSYDKAANQLVTSVHTWLVRDDAGMVLLVDTCFGNLKNRLPTHPFFHMRKTDWLSKLAALGVQPEDVTHVINTHLHLDLWALSRDAAKSKRTCSLNGMNRPAALPSNPASDYHC